MSDPAESKDQPTGRRGEAAWKEHRERIAARNDQVRKEAKARREAGEREKSQERRDRDRREMAELVGKRKR